MPVNVDFSIDDIEAAWCRVDGLDQVHSCYVGSILRAKQALMREMSWYAIMTAS